MRVLARMREILPAQDLQICKGSIVGLWIVHFV